MFPTLKVFVSGLDNDLDYNIQLEIRSVDSKRYRYVYTRFDILFTPFISVNVFITLITKEKENVNFWVLQL